MTLLSTQKLKQNGTKRIRRSRDTQEIVRFWWTIYRELIVNRRLRGGLSEKNLDLEETFKRKRKEFYAAWGDVTQTTYVAWWKKHREMFIEEAAIQSVANEVTTRSASRLYVSINLKKSHSALLRTLSSYIVTEQKKRGLAQQDRSVADRSKRIGKREAQFRYNERTEIHLPTFRALYNFFRFVYVEVLYKDQADLTGDVMKGQTLLDATKRRYAGKAMPKYLQLNRTATQQQRRSVLRTLRRYVLKLDDLVLRVASGQFP